MFPLSTLSIDFNNQSADRVTPPPPKKKKNYAWENLLIVKHTKNSLVLDLTSRDWAGSVNQLRQEQFFSHLYVKAGHLQCAHCILRTMWTRRDVS